MKFMGIVGFWKNDEETTPDVWRPKIVEKSYVCEEASKQNRQSQPSSYQNENLIVNNQISILSDLYAMENWHSIRYIVWNRIPWRVSRVTVEYPRLILELGGVYNRERPDPIGDGTKDNSRIE